MRRWFTALLTLLVAAQLSWAGAALCCVDELAGEPTQRTSLLSGEQAHAAPAGDAHPVCETGHCHCHHAGSATPAAQADAPAGPRTLAPEPAEVARLKSHIPAGLERPNWLRA
jgi:hypothetical protein